MSGADGTAWHPEGRWAATVMRLVVFDAIRSTGHEIGFSPDGRFLVMMNNRRAVFSCVDPDPRNWQGCAP